MTIPAGWQIDIGLEIHAQLNTQSKIFSGASTLFGQSPNSQACAIDLGMPGVLPSVNAEVFKKAVEKMSESVQFTLESTKCNT